MAGVESIIEDILGEAGQQAEAILKEAGEKAEELKSAARREAEEIEERMKGKARKDTEDYASRIQSQIALRKRQSLLGVKQEIISGIIYKCYEALLVQDEESYFDMLTELLPRAVRPGRGEIAFSAGDLARLPESFKKRIEEISSAAGGELEISSETADIDGGFILRYGEVEENCSLKALFDEKQNILQDEVRRDLW